MEEGTEKQKAEAEARNKRMQELNKFIHYYSRFKNHENSFKVSSSLVARLEMHCFKMKHLHTFQTFSLIVKNGSLLFKWLHLKG